MMRLKWLVICLLLPVACSLFPLKTYAQLSEEELRRERQETLDELRRTQQAYKDYERGPGWQFHFGSWISTSYTGSDNDDRDVATQDVLDHTWDNDLRFFVNGKSGDDRTKFYVRVGTTYTSNSKVSPTIAKSDWIQPALEMMYLERSYGTTSAHNLTFGRQYVDVYGQLAFAAVADGLKYELKTRSQNFQAFLVHQMPTENNIDFLASSPGRSSRWFYGLQHFWNYTPVHSVNVFGVGNVDANSDKPDATGQRHQLDSVYLGGTMFGTLFSRLKYELQYIKEFGKTFSDTSATNPTPDSKVDISADALTAQLAYYFSGSLGLMIHGDYLYGSGDGDAVGNVFSTDGGSGSLNGSGNGGKDLRFISFGGKNLGFALAPTLTNLHVMKFGTSLKPFGWAENRLWNEMKFHPQFYIYRRDKSTGATSDPYMIRGAGASKSVGHEIDLDVSWRLMSDVKYTFKIGKFFPGSAYATKSSETLLRLKISVDL